MKNNLKLVALTLLFICAVQAEAVAQNGTYYTIQDFEAWTSAKLKYKVNSKWSLGMEHQYRMKDDAANMDSYLAELSIKRRIGDNLSLGFASRYILKNDNEGEQQGLENYYRWNGDVGYKHDLNRFTMKYRFRYQARNELGVDDAKDKTVRLKVGTGYNIKKWKLDPEFSAEIFNTISNDDGFDRIRFTLGSAYKTKKYGEFGGFYRIEKELIGTYPKTTYIAGFAYEYTLKKKKND